jgi:hypothetical protein
MRLYLLPPNIKMSVGQIDAFDGPHICVVYSFAMSAIGISRTFELFQPMSAFGGEADSARTCRHVR